MSSTRYILAGGVVLAGSAFLAYRFYDAFLRPVRELPHYQEILDMIRGPDAKPPTYPPIAPADPAIVEAIIDNHGRYNQVGGTHRHPTLVSEQEQLRLEAIANFERHQQHLRDLADHAERLRQWELENKSR